MSARFYGGIRKKIQLKIKSLVRNTAEVSKYSGHCCSKIASTAKKHFGLSVCNSSKNYENPRPIELLVTTCGQNSKTSKEIVSELMRIFPRASYCEKRNLNLCDLMSLSRRLRNVLLCDGSSTPKTLVIIHPPLNQTVYFKIFGLKRSDELINRERFESQPPDLILNNFSTSKQKRIGRILASLFTGKCQFTSERFITFQNHKDGILFRQYYHKMRLEKGNGLLENTNSRIRKSNVLEIGPRFTLQLQDLKEGILS
jgi:rRNA maturation protein Rpf1